MIHQLEIDSGVKNFWKLKAIDSIQGSNEMDRQECANIISIGLIYFKISKCFSP